MHREGPESLDRRKLALFEAQRVFAAALIGFQQRSALRRWIDGVLRAVCAESCREDTRALDVVGSIEPGLCGEQPAVLTLDRGELQDDGSNESFGRRASQSDSRALPSKLFPASRPIAMKRWSRRRVRGRRRVALHQIGESPFTGPSPPSSYRSRNRPCQPAAHSLCPTS